MNQRADPELTSSCIGRITEALETVSRHRRHFFSRHALAQRHAEALQSCTKELDALVVDTTVCNT